MIKNAIKKLFNLFGLEIRKLEQQPSKKLAVAETTIPVVEKTRRLTLHNTPTGDYYLPTDAKRDVVAKAIAAGLIFEEEVVELAKKYIKPGTTVLDVGANFGQMSILFSNIVGDQGKVHSFEADDWIYEIFSKNIQANHKEGKVIPHFGAVHNIAGETLIFPDHDLKEWGTYGAYGIDYNATSGRQVKTITVDGLDIQEPISFMKIDIQGGDLQAMQGAVNTIKRHQMPILFEYEYHFEERYNLSFQDYVDFVRSIKYKFHKTMSGHNYLIIPE
jgi:FkbM family methyltransferase